MEFKGTKGKWTLQFSARGNLFLMCENQSYYISKIFKGDRSQEENSANALLISKAPEILEMLKRSKTEINHLKYTYKDSGHCCEYLFKCEQLIQEATELNN